MCSGGKSVLSFNALSSLSPWRVTSKASLTVTLVNKLTITSSGCRYTPLSISTKCFEFRTKESDNHNGTALYLLCSTIDT